MNIKNMFFKNRLKIKPLMPSFSTMTIGMVFLLSFPVSYAEVRKKEQSREQKDSSQKSFSVLSKEQRKLLAKIFLQADSVHREFYRVTSGKENLVLKTPFGKIYRSLEQSAGEVLTLKNRFKCDSYLVRATGENFPKKILVYENCNPKNPPTEIAELTWLKPVEIRVAFTTSNLAEVLGLAASIVGKDFSCSLYLSAENKLQSYICEHWYQEAASSEVYEFQNYHFSEADDPQIKSEGLVLKDFLPHRKIQIIVPKQGKIKVVETLLKAPEKTGKDAAKQSLLKPSQGQKHHGRVNGQVPNVGIDVAKPEGERSGKENQIYQIEEKHKGQDQGFKSKDKNQSQQQAGQGQEQIEQGQISSQDEGQGGLQDEDQKNINNQAGEKQQGHFEGNENENSFEGQTIQGAVPAPIPPPGSPSGEANENR